MYLSSLILGVILTVAGAAAVAYGIPINEFGLGNTAIVAGTVAFSAGLILVSLAEVIRQLRRISESLMIQPGLGVPHVEDLSEPVISSPRKAPASSRIPFPPKPEPRDQVPPPVMSPEPRLDTAPSLEPAGEPMDRPPPPAFMRNMPEPRVIPEPDEAPSLAPAGSRFTASREQKDELSEGLLATAFSRLDVSLRPAPPADEPPKQNEMFGSLWPEPGRTSEPQPSLESVAPRFEALKEESAPPEKSEEPFAVSILKSGVVDGMAYTLYSDGSIEAEMPEGTMRFASITELRAYLEKSPS